MSTKIYNAYRLRRGFDFYDTLAEIQARALKHCAGVLKKRFGPLDDAVLRDIGKKYRAQRYESEKNDFDLDVSLALHPDGRRWLLRAFAGSGYFHECLDFLQRFRAVEDFHYQNSHDRPKNVTARAWLNRKRTWDRVMPFGSTHVMLTFDIVHVDTWWKLWRTA